jgi:hypothetical protein
MRIFNLQGRDGPPSGSFGVSRSIHRRHGAVRVFWIEWDIWPSSEEAAGVGRLFQRRGKLEKGVQGLVLRTLDGSLAPRGGARDIDPPPTDLPLTMEDYGFLLGLALGAFLTRALVCIGRNFYLGSAGSLPVNKPLH